MFIKAFLYANTKDESMKIITDILSPLNIEMGKTKIELEPYWKINGIFSNPTEAFLPSLPAPAPMY